MPPAIILWSSILVTKKVCVFVDGENFRYSIIELFKQEFDKADYLPKHADGIRFLSGSCPKLLKTAKESGHIGMLFNHRISIPTDFPRPKKNLISCDGSSKKTNHAVKN